MVELPEPNHLGEYEIGDAVVMPPVCGRPADAFAGKWYVSCGDAIAGLGDKKRYHDTPEAAAAWLAARGYGPGANRGEGDRGGDG